MIATYSPPTRSARTNTGDYVVVWNRYDTATSTGVVAQYVRPPDTPTAVELMALDDLPAPRALADHLVVRRSRPSRPRRALQALAVSLEPAVRWPSRLKSFKR